MSLVFACLSFPGFSKIQECSCQNHKIRKGGLLAKWEEVEGVWLDANWPLLLIL